MCWLVSPFIKAIFARMFILWENCTFGTTILNLYLLFIEEFNHTDKISIGAFCSLA